MKHRKIYIIGISASGKTYLARKLSEITKIKNYDLDEIVFKKNSFERIDKKIRKNKLKNILAKKTWIIEGAYAREWIIPIYKKAELIILLDLSYKTIKRRVIIRSIKRKLKLVKTKREEKLKDILDLLKYIKNYYKESLPFHRKLIRKYKKKVIILKNKEEIKEFVTNLK